MNLPGNLPGGCFIGIAIVAYPGPGYLPVAISPVPLVVRHDPTPKRRQLVGWEELVACSRKNGGPGTMGGLRYLAQRDPLGVGSAIYVSKDRKGNGTVPPTAYEHELIAALRYRYIPLGLQTLAERDLKKPRRRQRRQCVG